MHIKIILGYLLDLQGTSIRITIRSTAALSLNRIYFLFIVIHIYNIQVAARLSCLSSKFKNN